MSEFHLKPFDARDQRIQKGHHVRVIGIPDLSDMDPMCRTESKMVFLHIRGMRKRVEGFNHYGFAELFFKIRKGPLAGWHSVAIEPNLLLVQYTPKL